MPKKLTLQEKQIRSCERKIANRKKKLREMIAWYENESEAVKEETKQLEDFLRFLRKGT